MKVGQKQNLSIRPPVVNKFDEIDLLNLLDDVYESEKDHSSFSDLAKKSGTSITNIDLNFSDSEETDPVKEKNKSESKSELGLSITPKKNSKLTSVDFRGSYFNDSNMFEKNEDDLGMTASYSANANLSFLNKNGSNTNISLNNNSALHTQFLSKEDDLTDQSLISTNNFEVGVKNDKWIIKNPDISVGAKVQLKTLNTDPSSGWAETQRKHHESFDFREYDNQENPFVNNEAYITPMMTVGFDKEKIIKDKLYLKTEAQVGLGTMVPLQNKSQFYTPIIGEASGSVKVGYSYKSKPIFYVKADANISNESLPYNRDNGTMGALGLSIGNEFTVIRNKKFDLSLGLESRILKPFGNLSNNPLPDQYGKHDFIHEMASFKLKINLK